MTGLVHITSAQVAYTPLLVVDAGAPFEIDFQPTFVAGNRILITFGASFRADDISVFGADIVLFRLSLVTTSGTTILTEIGQREGGGPFSGAAAIPVLTAPLAAEAAMKIAVEWRIVFASNGAQIDPAATDGGVPCNAQMTLFQMAP